MTEVQKGIGRYLLFLQAEQNKAKLTVSHYRDSLRFMLFLCPDFKRFKDFNKNSIKLYRQELNIYTTAQGRSLSTRTKNHHLSILRAFLRYLIQEEELDVHPPDRIKLSQEEERKVKVLQKDEVLALLAAPSKHTIKGLRDRAILNLFFSTGMRHAELQALNRRDVNFKTREMSIRGKGSKVRVVFLSDRAAKSIRDYMNRRNDHINPLFICDHNRALTAMPPGDNFRISYSQIYKIVSKYSRQVGLSILPSPHTLRHSFATDLLRNGADIRSVQEMLGHKDIVTTQIYTHVTNPQLKEIHRQFHDTRRHEQVGNNESVG